MLHPAPTSAVARDLARGVLEGIIPATATKPAFAEVSFYNSDYRCHLLAAGGQFPADIESKVGKTITATIRTTAKRIDIVGTGGKLIDPVFGPPRRLHGRIVSVDAAKGTLTVNAGQPFICRVSAPGQKAGDFEPMQFVAFNIEPGATIEFVSA